MYICEVEEHFCFLIFSTCHFPIEVHLFQLEERNGKFPLQRTPLSALDMFFWSVNRRVFFCCCCSLCRCTAFPVMPQV